MSGVQLKKKQTHKKPKSSPSAMWHLVSRILSHTSKIAYELEFALL